VHHDASEAASLTRSLEGAGYSARAQALSSEASQPDATGFEVVVLGAKGAPTVARDLCGQLRSGGYTGSIIVLGASGDDVVPLLDAGADDVVSPPVRPDDLVARLHVVSRRTGPRSRLQCGPLELDPAHRSASLRGSALMLTRREYSLLACLAEARGAVVSRVDLLGRIWDRDEEPGSNLVEVHLSRLRDKLGADAGLVETVRRVGYRLRA
jgi:DNA-binding response OmpR family regulator